MSIMHQQTRRVKPTRRTPRPDAPFGVGVLRSLPEARWGHTAADEDWYAREFAAADGPTDAELDALAAERAWEDAAADGFLADERCARCGWATDFRDARGWCPPCVLAEESAVS